ncbi:hypothetical protein C8J57DRAFT_1273350 [Mycena rebaudengoi]|nr:hypothetical protein C8J57DRAFT_1273350 [Mycena rebaudengoi]
MTRTARSTSFRSVMKDRSESKNGLDNSIRKNGGGAHNWGSLENERDLELSGYEDGQQELDEDSSTRLEDDDDSRSGHSEPSKVSSPVLERSDEDIALAKKMRTNAFKHEGVDLVAIARTSAAISASPPRATVASDIRAASIASSV